MSEASELDQDLYWLNGKPKTIEDIACFEVCCTNQDKIIAKLIRQREAELAKQIYNNFEKLFIELENYYKVNLWYSATPTAEQTVVYEMQKTKILHLAKKACQLKGE